MKLHSVCLVVFGLAALTVATPTLVSTSKTTTALCHVRTEAFDSKTRSTTAEFLAHGLYYKGFEVVKASQSSTFFNAKSPPNLLALPPGKMGVISIEQKPTKETSNYFYPLNFYTGCATFSAKGVAMPANCSVNLATPVDDMGAGPVTIEYLDNAAAHPSNHALLLVQWSGPGTPYINVSISDAPKNTFFYFDSFNYSINCFA